MRFMKKTLSILVLALLLCSVCLTASAGQKNNKAGWFSKGNNTYYRTENGSLVKNQEIKIGESRYRFDKKGRLVKKNVTSGIYVTEYDKKTGKYLDTYVDLKVISTDRTSVLAKTVKSDRGVKQKFWIGKNGVSVLNKKGRKTSFDKLKKNAKIRVYFDSESGILETYPAQFGAILKIRIQ